MTNNNSDKENLMDAFPISEESILLDFDKPLGVKQLAYAALQRLMNEQNLKFSSPLIDRLKNDLQIIKINNFSIQVVTTGFDSENISIPLEYWTKRRNAPQLILAAQVDDENNIVLFKGVLTNSEIHSLIPNSAFEDDN